VKLRKSSPVWSLSLVVGITLLVTTGLGSLGVVWLRVEISRVAEDSRKLEKQVTENARELRSLSAKRAKALNPSSLKRLVSGRLSKPPSNHVVFVHQEDLERRQLIPSPHFPKVNKNKGGVRLQRLALR